MTPARAAIAEGWPVLVTAVVVGVTFGVVARQSGLSALEASASSVLVFAGAAQFAAVGLLREGASALEVAASILLINLRHLLMAAALRAHFSAASLVQRLGLGYLLTDESFAMGVGHFRRGHRDLAYYATFGALLWACWNAGTLAGAIFGAGLEQPERYGVDFAITATFLAIVALGVRHRADVIVAVVAGIVAAALRLAGATTLAVVIAGALAPLVALVLRVPATDAPDDRFGTRG